MSVFEARHRAILFSIFVLLIFIARWQINMMMMMMIVLNIFGVTLQSYKQLRVHLHFVKARFKSFNIIIHGAGRVINELLSILQTASAMSLRAST